MADIKWYEKGMMVVVLLTALVSMIITNSSLARIGWWYQINFISSLVCVAVFPVCMFCIWLRRRFAGR